MAAFWGLVDGFWGFYPHRSTENGDGIGRMKVRGFEGGFWGPGGFWGDLGAMWGKFWGGFEGGSMGFHGAFGGILGV